MNLMDVAWAQWLRLVMMIPYVEGFACSKLYLAMWQKESMIPIRSTSVIGGQFVPTCSMCTIFLEMNHWRIICMATSD